MSWCHLEDRERRASKQYRCCLCELRIRKGAKHIVRTGIDSGTGYVTMRMHAVCEAQTWGWGDDEWETRVLSGADFREYELGMRR